MADPRDIYNYGAVRKSQTADTVGAPDGKTIRNAARVSGKETLTDGFRIHAYTDNF